LVVELADERPAADDITEAFRQPASTYRTETAHNVSNPRTANTQGDG
jgi:hypothetical protein